MRLAISISLLLIALLISPYLLKINKVVCSSQFGSCSPKIEMAADQLIGVNYKSLDREIEKIKVLKNEVEEYKYFYVPPSTLNISVIEKKGEVAYKHLDGNEIFIYSDDLSLTSTVSETLLPVVYTDIGEFSDHPSFKFVNELVIALSRYYSVNEAIWSKNSITIVYNEETEIIFPTSGDIDALLGSLELMLFQLNKGLQNSKIELAADEVSSIDLRYKNPIIK